MEKFRLVVLLIFAAAPLACGWSAASAAEMPEGTLEFSTAFLFDHSIYSGDALGDVETAWVFPTVGAGIRFLVTETAALSSGAFYRHAKAYLGAKGISVDSVSLGVGISVLLR